MAKHSATSSLAAKPAPASSELARHPSVAAALEWLAKNTAIITEEQIRITEIPAPTFQEAHRAGHLKKLLAGCGLNVVMDDLGNVIGERPGAISDVLLLTAHLDTVFPEGTPIKVKREKGILFAPGISDNAAGLASIVAIARAMKEARLLTRQTIVFAADVGEEGEGNLRGVTKLVERYGSRLKAVVAIDGSSTDYVVAQALASKRLEISISGPGGHSWTDFGTPNPIHALARGIARFMQVQIPQTPRTTFNFGQIDGGSSVNTIAARAAVKVDIRSEQDREITRLESALRDAMRLGVAEEMTASESRGNPNARGSGLQIQVTVLGVRPGGELAANSPLLHAVHAADRCVGNRSTIERSSTDANIPLSLGIPAISLGAGGHAGGAHTLEEWYNPAGRELGLKRLLLTILGVAGVEK
jgi:tripeptide aminopeptidase